MTAPLAGQTNENETVIVASVLEHTPTSQPRPDFTAIWHFFGCRLAQTWSPLYWHREEDATGGRHMSAGTLTGLRPSRISPAI